MNFNYTKLPHKRNILQLNFYKIKYYDKKYLKNIQIYNSKNSNLNKKNMNFDISVIYKHLFETQNLNKTPFLVFMVPLP